MPALGSFPGRWPLDKVLGVGVKNTWANLDDGRVKSTVTKRKC